MQHLISFLMLIGCAAVWLKLAARAAAPLGTPMAQRRCVAYKLDTQDAAQRLLSDRVMSEHEIRAHTLHKGAPTFMK